MPEPNLSDSFWYNFGGSGSTVGGIGGTGSSSYYSEWYRQWLQDTENAKEAAQKERTWGSYLPGVEAGDLAAQYWADIAVSSGHPLAFLAHVPGVFAALWTDQTAATTAVTLGTAGLGSLPSVGSKLGQKLFLSETFGITSTRLSYSVTGVSGSFNVTGSLFKVGWSSVSRNGGGMMLRVGLGGTGNTARFHFYMPGSFVPNSFANGSIQLKRALYKMGQ
ncbi:hypothetical protein [Microbulbifer spongiae]|uniref:Uncharacterized protein n=1 Tax=Microbulbifer spongiae TaxID=2944933 RepID=A0ABY9EDH1_9GAMM|nr:hypothetical protein [Microbulbifer sp. MI-G]WKD51030.1 hypothetical protein M8T91_06310 [Microbulbifer sp. MI-G]